LFCSFVYLYRLDGQNVDGRFLASNMVEVSTNRAEDDDDGCEDGMPFWGRGTSPLLPIDPATLASGDGAMSAAAKLQEVASRVSLGA
jgi:hypothetical protein